MNKLFNLAGGGLSALVLLASLAGCASLPDKRIHASGWVKKRFAFDRFSERFGASSRLEVEFRITNKTKQLRTVEYRFEWRLKNGRWLKSPAPRWQTAYVRANDGTYIAADSPSITVSDFRVKLRRGKN